MYRRLGRHGHHEHASHQHHSHAGHCAVIRMLDRLQLLIVHTCAHRDQPIYSVDMVEHIIDEVDEMHDEVEEIAEELCHFADHIEAYMEAKKALCDLKGIFDDLHEKLHEGLCGACVTTPPQMPANPSQLPSYPPMHAEKIRNALMEACPRIRREYDDLVHDMHRLGLISKEIKSTHVL